MKLDEYNVQMLHCSCKTAFSTIGTKSVVVCESLKMSVLYTTH